MGFEEYKKVFDLSSFKLNKTDDSAFKNNYQMLNMRQLATTIDSLEHTTDSYQSQSQLLLSSHIHILKYLDSPWKSRIPIAKIDSFAQLVPDSILHNLLQSAFSNINNIKSSTDISALTYENDR